MAFFDVVWYCNFGDGSTTGYYAVAKRPQNAAVAAGQLCRQFTAPSVGNERVFVCRTAGTTANTTDATWTITRGAQVTDGTATWSECTGMSSVNGDAANTFSWAQMKAVGTPSLGVIIKTNSGSSYQCCTTAGTLGAAEPAFSDTAGTSTAESGGTATWRSLGVVGNFTGGQAPHARLQSVFTSTWFTSGNTVYVGDNHAETGSGTINISLASALLAKVLCHNHSGSYPPTDSNIMTGASITPGSSITFSSQGSFYFYGITFSTTSAGVFIGASAVGQVQNWYCFDNCSFWLAGIGQLIMGATSTAWGIVTFNNTTVKFGGTTGYILPYFCRFIWQNTGQILASGSSVPTTLLQQSNSSGRFNEFVLRNLDLSQLTGSLFTNASNSSIGSLIVQDCKLNAAMTITTPINSGMNVQLIRSDSAATAYKSTRVAYEGTETTETSIVRTGGAVDPNGQAQARKIVTSANAEWLRPFKSEPMAIWNSTVGSAVTATVCGTVNAGALPNNDDIWLETEYLGTSTDPKGTIVTTTKSNVLASNAAVASDSSVWATPAPWSPADLGADLWAWWKFDAMSEANGVAVATVTDSSGNSRTLTTANSPTAKTNAQNSLKALDFAGGVKYATFASASALTSGSFFAVNKGVSGDTGGICDMGSDTQNNHYTFGGTVYSDFLSNSRKTAGAVAVNIWHQVMLWSAPSDWGHAMDGTDKFTTGSNTVAGRATTSYFASDAVSTWFHGGEFGEVIILQNKPTTLNRQKLEGYLAWKWGLVASLPGGHPYKTSSPSAGWLPFKLASTITPQLPGYIHARVRVGKASATYYVDPKVTVAAYVWSPTALTGLVGWWDASVTASLNLTGSSINSVADQSGLGNTMNWESAKPTYNATGFNSTKPALVFSSAGVNVLKATSFPMSSGNTLTLWLVTTMGATGTQNYGRYFSYLGGSGGVDYGSPTSWLFAQNGTSSTQCVLYRNSTTAVATTTAYPAPHRLIATIKSDGTFTVYVDGVSAGTAASGGNWSDAGTLRIGNDPGLASQFAGPIAECGIATGYSDATTVAALDTYLKNKWGL